MGKSHPTIAPNYQGEYLVKPHHDKDGNYVDGVRWDANDPSHPANAVYSPGLADRQYDSGKKSVQQQTLANRPDIDTPWASEKWGQDASGNWTLNKSLSPELAAAQQSLAAQLRGSASGPQMTGSGARDQAIQSAMGEFHGEMSPTWDTRQSDLSSNLAAQGLDSSGSDYSHAMDNFAGQRADAYSGANNAAIGRGTADGQALFARNTAQQQQNMQLLHGLYGFGNMPTYNNAAAWTPGAYLDAAHGGDEQQLNFSNAQDQAAADEASGLTSLGQTAAGAGGGYRGSSNSTYNSNKDVIV